MPSPSTNDVPAEDGVRETEPNAAKLQRLREACIKYGYEPTEVARNDLAWRVAEDFFGQPAQAEALAESMGCGNRTDLGEAAVIYEYVIREASLAALAQQADGETVRLVREMERNLVLRGNARREAMRTGTVEACGNAERSESEFDAAKIALLAHVAGQAARHREADNRIYTAQDMDAYRDGLNSIHAEERDKLEAEVARLRARVDEAMGVLNSHACFTACHHESTSECTESIHASMLDALEGGPT